MMLEKRIEQLESRVRELETLLAGIPARFPVQPPEKLRRVRCTLNEDLLAGDTADATIIGIIPEKTIEVRDRLMSGGQSIVEGKTVWALWVDNDREWLMIAVQCGDVED